MTYYITIVVTQSSFIYAYIIRFLLYVDNVMLVYNIDDSY